jgi:hypothetical protein
MVSYARRRALIVLSVFRVRVRGSLSHFAIDIAMRAVRFGRGDGAFAGSCCRRQGEESENYKG